MRQLLAAGALLALAALFPAGNTFTIPADGRGPVTLRSLGAAEQAGHVVIRGTADRDDTLVIELPVAAKSIDYDGGAGGFDVLELRGGSARRQVVTQLTPHDGIIDIDGLVIRYFNLEPITDTAPAAAYVINGTAGADTVTVTDGPGGTTTVSSPTFESVTFANKTSVVFDGLGGGDSITFNNPTPATGLTSFIVQNVATVGQTSGIRYPAFGASATGNISLNHPNDVDNVELATTGGMISFNDTDDVIIGGVSPALAGIAAGNIVTFSAQGDVTVDAAATVTAVSVQIGSNAGGVSVNGAVTSGGGILLLVHSPEGVTIDAAVQSQTGNVTMQTTRLVIGATGTIAASLGTVEIETFNAGPNINLGSTTDAMGTGIEVSDAEIDRITAPVLVFETNIGVLTVSQPISFNGRLVLRAPNAFSATGTGSLSAPTLTFGSTAAGARTWTITPTFVQQSGSGSAPVPYSGVTMLNIATSLIGFFPSNAPDTFVVTPSATTTINIDAGRPEPSEAPPHDTLDFELAGVVSPVLTATLGPDGYSGSLTSANRQPIHFEEIENFIDAPVDLAATKTDNATSLVAGPQVNYTITVSNSAPIPVAGVAVVDTLPAALTGVTWTCGSSSGTVCTAAGSGNIDEMVTFAANGAVVFSVTGTLIPSATGTLTNTVNVTTPAGFVETNPANNSATDTSAITAQANLIVTKSGPSGTTFAGGDLTYTITLRNAGPSDAQTVTLTDVIPTNTRFVSLTAAPGYTCTTPAANATGTVTCTRAVLPPSATADPFTLTVRVDRPVAAGTTITNTATATTATVDPAPANNSATAPAITVAEVSIPTLSEWMLLLLAVMLALVAVKKAM